MYLLFFGFSCIFQQRGFFYLLHKHIFIVCQPVNSCPTYKQCSTKKHPNSHRTIASLNVEQIRHDMLGQKCMLSVRCIHSFATTNICASVFIGLSFVSAKGCDGVMNPNKQPMSYRYIHVSVSIHRTHCTLLAPESDNI